MALDNTFVADEAVLSALASQHFTGTRYARFAVIDLGLGMADGPTALVQACLQFRARRPGHARFEIGDRAARHVVAVEASGAGKATVIGCVRVSLRSPEGTPQLPVPAWAAAWDDGSQVEISRFIVRHQDAPVRLWVHAWLVSEALRETVAHRLPWAFAFVAPEVEPALKQIGVRFESMGGPQYLTGNRHPHVMLRINALASLQRLRLDYRVPKVAVGRWAA